MSYRRCSSSSRDACCGNLACVQQSTLNPKPSANLRPRLMGVCVQALSTPGMPGLIAAMSTYEFHEDVQQCDFGVQVTATHVPHLWYLSHEVRSVSVPMEIFHLCGILCGVG